ncbi:MAG: hypothetical protein V8R14_04840 [Clostridia bacterium]
MRETSVTWSSRSETTAWECLKNSGKTPGMPQAQYVIRRQYSSAFGAE